MHICLKPRNPNAIPAKKRKGGMHADKRKKKKNKKEIIKEYENLTPNNVY